ncbi:MAG: hypothetical protein V3T84_13670 [Phycisphaerales bacterium]
MAMLLTLVGVAFVVGFTLALIGWRGKRTDDHPLCRRCKYDLVGTEAIPKQCPECGSLLATPRATRIGNRRRRRATLTVGLVVSLLSLSSGGFLGWSQAKQFDWYPYKPLWMLSNEAMSTFPRGQVNLPQREIRRRLEDDKLSDRQINGLIEKALSIQADETKTWDYFWGDVIEKTWDKDKISEDQLIRYIKTAVRNALHLSVRARVRQGECVMIRRGFGPNVRAGNSHRIFVTRDYGPLRIDDIEVRASFGHRASSLDGRGGSSRHGSMFTINASLGKHEMSLQCRFRAAPSDSIEAEAFFEMSWEDVEKIVEAHKFLDWIDTVRVPVEVVAPGDPVIDLVDDPALKEIIRKAITIQQIRLTQGRRLEARCWFEFDALPMPVGFEVFWRVGEREWLVQSITALESAGSVYSHRHWFGAKGFPIDATHVDIILRSSVRIAEGRVALNRIWQGEIVFPNQPLTRDIEKK